MQKANKISAFFFIGLFSLMLLHQGFPHLHHQHEDSHSDIAHSGEHHHHDNDSEEKEESPYGFFDFFMDVHTHSSFSSDIVILKRNTIEQQSNDDKNLAKSIINNQIHTLVEYRHNSKLLVYHSPNTYFIPYLYCLDSRGPPTLG